MKPLFFAFVVLAIAPTPAAAQTHIGSTRPAQDRPGLIAFGAYEVLNVASPKTFDAVFGTSTLQGVGGGLDVVNVWKHAFLRIAKSTASLDGERIAIAGNEVFKLGTKLTLTMTLTEVGAGWRFEARNGNRRITPYAGAAAVFLSYKETSTFADAGDNVGETFKGFGAFGGVDVKVASRILAGAEAQYRSINSSPSAGSAAGKFNEKNLGGAVFRVRVGVRF